MRGRSRSTERLRVPPRHSECSQSLRCTTLQRNCFERLIGAGRGAQTNKLGIGRAATRPSVRARPILPYECMQHATQHCAAATERHRSNRLSPPRHSRRTPLHRSAQRQRAYALHCARSARAVQRVCVCRRTQWRAGCAVVFAEDYRTRCI
jgi:hypothetical protein